MSQVTEQIEDIAASIVAALTDAETRRLDVGGPHQVADFELLHRGDKVGLLEISSSTQPARLSQSAALARHMPKRLDGSKRAWHLVLRDERFNAKTLGRNLPHLLLEIEKQVPEGHFAQIHDTLTQKFFPNGLSAGINTELYNLGILFLYSLTAGAPSVEGWLDVQQSSVGGAIGPSLVTDEVNPVLQQADNQTKLLAGGGPRSELFVWLLDTIGAMAMTIPNAAGVFDAGGPNNAPQIPEGISRVWVASYPTLEQSPARAVWSSTGGAWRIHEVPRLRSISR